MAHDDISSEPTHVAAVNRVFPEEYPDRRSQPRPEGDPVDSADKRAAASKAASEGVPETGLSSFLDALLPASAIGPEETKPGDPATPPRRQPGEGQPPSQPQQQGQGQGQGQGLSTAIDTAAQQAISVLKSLLGGQ